ncbi:MAG TPA: hypothetical protein VGC45_05060 [Gryllotalpicola sp.]
MGNQYLAGIGITDNDRMALRLTPPWHAEVVTHARTGDVLLVACDCELGDDHSYSDRRAHTEGTLKRAS